MAKMHEAQAVESGFREEIQRLESDYTRLRGELTEFQKTLRKPEYAKIPTDKVDVELKLTQLRIEKAKVASSEIKDKLVAYSNKYLKQ